MAAIMQRMAVRHDQVASAEPSDAGSYARPLPNSHHPGAVRAFELDADEELQWRRWSPRVGDVVLVEMQDGTVWPAKVRKVDMMC